MIALLAQLAVGCFAAYGLVTAAYQAMLRALDWYGRRAQARHDREKVQIAAASREVANTWMLARLTAEDYETILNIIHDSQTEAA